MAVGDSFLLGFGRIVFMLEKIDACMISCFCAIPCLYAFNQKLAVSTIADK